VELRLAEFRWRAGTVDSRTYSHAERLQNVAGPGRVECAFKLKRNLSALIESTENLIWSVDPRYRLITFNRAFKEHIERSYGGPVAPGMSLSELLPPALAVLWASALSASALWSEVSY